MDVAAHCLQAFERSAGQCQELVVHPREMLADDEEAGIRQQVVDVGDAAGDRILHRQHGEPGAAALHRGDRLLEAGAGEGAPFGEDLAAGEVGIGTGRALEGDKALGIGFGFHGWAGWRAA